MSKKETAEQKLLRIIEEGSEGSSESKALEGATTPAMNVAQQTAAAVRGPSLQVPSFAENVSDIMKKISQMIPLGKSFGLREINMLSILFIIILAIMLVAISQAEIRRINKGVHFKEFALESSMRTTGTILPQYKDIGQFLDTISFRNIFRPYEKVESPAVATQATGQELISQKMEKLKIVGISWFDEPDSQSVMVEQTDTSMTYFLKQGESFDGLTVKAIFTDRVIFSYQNEEMEMRL